MRIDFAFIHIIHVLLLMFPISNINSKYDENEFNSYRIDYDDLLYLLRKGFDLLLSAKVFPSDIKNRLNPHDEDSAF